MSTIRCPSCRRLLQRVPGAANAVSVRCPSCATVFEVPPEREEPGVAEPPRPPSPRPPPADDRPAPRPPVRRTVVRDAPWERQLIGLGTLAGMVVLAGVAIYLVHWYYTPPPSSPVRIDPLQRSKESTVLVRV